MDGKISLLRLASEEHQEKRADCNFSEGNRGAASKEVAID
jgi:hypothetical protein